MIIPPTIAFLAWIPASLYFFWRRPVRVAILIDFLAGWALLPGASYTPTDVSFPYWILAASLPANYFVTKATVTGISCLLGILLFDRRVFRRLKIGFWDLPILVWCTVPLLAGVANPEFFASGLRGAAYLVLAWGVPYLAGRLYFSETESLRLAAKAFAIAGLAYVPICLIEMFTGPQIYAHLYGYQPFRWTGAHRYFGYRPIGLLEDGNQLGIWMATSAFIAIGLWKHRLVQAMLGIPIAAIAGTLFAVTLLCQSGGSILLLFGLLPIVFFSRRHLPRILTVVVLFGILAFAGLRLGNVVSLRSLVTHNHAANAVASLLQRAHRGSFGWRLSQDEKYVGVALDNPILGSGQWDWWKGSSSRPWGLWLLAFGLYGILGLLALECLQLIPVARIMLYPSDRSEIEASALGYILAGAILISAIDNLMNSAMLLPLLLIVGGMSARNSPVARDAARTRHVVRA